MEAVAKLNKSVIAPRKMRLMADLIRGVQVNQALAILKLEPKKCAIYIEKLLLSAIANWHEKNPSISLETAQLHVKTIYVNGASMLKRIMPAPQGRAHRIRKRFNHITVVVDHINVDKNKKTKLLN